VARTSVLIGKLFTPGLIFVGVITTLWLVLNTYRLWWLFHEIATFSPDFWERASVKEEINVSK
jgi:biopolymer transport protein ExbB/TolQ